MARYGLGLDTGGTYTDAVIMDLEDGSILSRSKSLTTRQDLSIGIRSAMEALGRENLRRADIVCLSSTLATNSVVEGRGCRVGLVAMGSQVTVRTMAEHSVTLSGRHTASRKEDEPLDEDGARRFLESVRGKVDCIAVTGFMSVRNPEHELLVKSMAEGILGVPVVCGHELSSSLGFNERTVTCVMNARLIPIIEELLASVDSVMAGFGMDAPLLIVKGDGSVMSEQMARRRPVETILSGPASSMNGAVRLTGIRDAVVVDIGGTTSDIGMIRGGRPDLSDEGAMIGGFRTRVTAAEITTAGMGGDSRIVVNGDRVSISPSRVVPVCVASSQYPEVGERIRELAEAGPRSIPVAHYPRNLVIDTEFFLKVRGPGTMDLSENDLRFLDFVSGRPRSMSEAVRALGEPPVSFDVQRMEDAGIVQRIGLTPTDLMHVRGKFTGFDAEASRNAVRYHSANLGMELEAFMSMVEELVAERIGTEVVRKAIYEDSGETDLQGFGLGMLEDAVSGRSRRDYRVRFQLDLPIIGIGGPSYDMLPTVASRLGTRLVIPDNYDVGNAVGAVCGRVEESVDILVQTVVGSTLASPACIVFSRMGRFYYEDFDRGVEKAREDGIAYVTEQARLAGAGEVEVTVEDRTSAVDIGKEHLARRVSEVRMRITASGDPAPRSRSARSLVGDGLQADDAGDGHQHEEHHPGVDLLEPEDGRGDDRQDHAYADPHGVGRAHGDTALHRYGEAKHAQQQRHEDHNVPEQVGHPLGVVQADGPSYLEDATQDDQRPGEVAVPGEVDGHLGHLQM